MDAQIERLLFGASTDPESEITERGEVLPRYTTDPLAADKITRHIEGAGGTVRMIETNGIIECFLQPPPSYLGWTVAEARGRSAPMALGMAVLRAAHKLMELHGRTYVQPDEIPADEGGQ
ncbi:MAG: hypothetical protein M3O82_06035 [Verrucomicrobiota bacterium]|nr:hypothetical protein [Verrucomicrobiota bacterium]